MLHLRVLEGMYPTNSGERIKGHIRVDERRESGDIPFRA